jgi:hypothetical protein
VKRFRPDTKRNKQLTLAIFARYVSGGFTATVMSGAVSAATLMNAGESQVRMLA